MLQCVFNAVASLKSICKTPKTLCYLGAHLIQKKNNSLFNINYNIYSGKNIQIVNFGAPSVLH